MKAISTLYENILDALSDRGITPGKMCGDLNLSKSLISDLKSGRKKSLSTENLKKMSDYLGVTLDDLIAGREKNAFTKKDERDIEKRLDKILSDLQDAQGAIMFDGAPLDDVTRELLFISLKNSMELGKKLAKQKFTPKKLRPGD